MLLETKYNEPKAESKAEPKSVPEPIITAPPLIIERKGILCAIGNTPMIEI